jgi:hypothetical protein
MDFPLSHSRIETFACPYRGQQIYLKGRKEPESIPALRGQIAHAIAAAYIRHCVAQGVETDLAALPEIFAREWLASKIPADEMDGLKEVIIKLAECISVNPYTQVELQIAITADWKPTSWFGKADTVFLRGILDRLDVADDVGVITDWYFGWGPAVAKRAQVRIYAALGNILYPEVERWHCRVFSPQHRTEAEEIISREEIPRIRKDIEMEAQRVMRLVEGKKFPAAPGDHCGFCGFKAECPAKEWAIEHLGDQASAEQAAAKLIVLEQETARIKGLLKTYTAAAGPLEVGGMTVGHNEVSTKIWDKAAVWDAAQDQDDPLSFFNVDGRRAHKLGITPETKTVVRFGLKKAGAAGEEE